MGKPLWPRVTVGSSDIKPENPLGIFTSCTRPAWFGATLLLLRELIYKEASPSPTSNMPPNSWSRS